MMIKFVKLDHHLNTSFTGTITLCEVGCGTQAMPVDVIQGQLHQCKESSLRCACIAAGRLD